MPYWTCEQCGARLYSASRTLSGHACPVCQATLDVEGDPQPPGRFEQADPASPDLPDAPGVRKEVDVPKHH
jgi:hypothetical protein